MKHVDIGIALYDYQAVNEEELSFNADSILYIIDNSDPDWYKAQLKDDGPVGFIPSNYIEKMNPNGRAKALYDYTAQSGTEVSFQENEPLTLFDSKDKDWSVVKTAQGKIGLAPSNYLKITAWAVALYAFKPESEEETYLLAHEKVRVVDESSPGWWTIEHQDGTRGMVPASYVKLQDETEGEQEVKSQEVLVGKPLVEEEEEARKRKQEEEARKKKQEEEARKKKQEEEEARKKKQEEEEARKKKQEEEARLKLEKERKRQEEEAHKREERSRQTEEDKRKGIEQERIKKIEEKENQRRAEAEKRQKLHEDAIKKELDEKRASLSSRRNQIPASPAIHSHDLKKANTRTWTDCTGNFSIDAQFMSFKNGKIRLQKPNGVEIDVPVDKMCKDDIRFVEQAVSFRWIDYFKKANLPEDACIDYARTFEANQLTEKDIKALTLDQLKMLGMTEKHVKYVQHFIRNGQPLSQEASPSQRMGRKKSVSFGQVSYIGDAQRSDHVKEEEIIQQQIEQDERMARELQEREEREERMARELREREEQDERMARELQEREEQEYNRGSRWSSPRMDSPPSLRQYGSSPSLDEANLRPVPPPPTVSSPVLQQYSPNMNASQSPQPFHAPPRNNYRYPPSSK